MNIFIFKIRGGFWCGFSDSSHFSASIHLFIIQIGALGARIRPFYETVGNNFRNGTVFNLLAPNKVWLLTNFKAPNLFWLAVPGLPAGLSDFRTLGIFEGLEH